MAGGKQRSFSIGDTVVVSVEAETCIYHITEICGGWANLGYYSGSKRLLGGAMPISLLRKPTKKQMAVGYGLKRE